MNQSKRILIGTGVLAVACFVLSGIFGLPYSGRYKLYLHSKHPTRAWNSAYMLDVRSGELWFVSGRSACPMSVEEFLGMSDVEKK